MIWKLTLDQGPNRDKLLSSKLVKFLNLSSELRRRHTVVDRVNSTHLGVGGFGTREGGHFGRSVVRTFLQTQTHHVRTMFERKHDLSETLLHQRRVRKQIAVDTDT